MSMIEWKKYLSLEIIVFVVVLFVAVYFYFKYDRQTIKIHNDIDYSILFKPIYTTGSQPPRKVQKRKRENKSENLCRKIFEDIFGKGFPSIRPDFLKNPTTGHNLELDGYCESLKLGFEYDGVQHAKFEKHFHKSTKDFVYQVAKDDFKTQKCKMLGIDLIRIPHYIHPNELKDYILRVLRKIPRFSHL